MEEHWISFLSGPNTSSVGVLTWKVDGDNFRDFWTKEKTSCWSLSLSLSFFLSLSLSLSVHVCVLRFAGARIGVCVCQMRKRETCLFVVLLLTEYNVCLHTYVCVYQLERKRLGVCLSVSFFVRVCVGGWYCVIQNSACVIQRYCVCGYMGVCVRECHGILEQLKRWK